MMVMKLVMRNCESSQWKVHRKQSDCFGLLSARVHYFFLELYCLLTYAFEINNNELIISEHITHFDHFRRGT